MQTRVATVAVVLLALLAAPAALAKGSVSIGGSLIAALQGGGHLQTTAIAVTRKDHMRSCQVGAERSQVRAANETERKAATVACEQPPRSNLNLPSGLKGAEAAALAAAG